MSQPEAPEHPPVFFEVPRRRSRARVLAGRIAFSVLRWLQWHASGTAWVPRGQRNPGCQVEYLHATHRTPLYRPLAGVSRELQDNKVHNLRIACAALDGLCIMPGQTLSYWRILGMPSARKGYRRGMVLINGRPDAYTGGGLCQLSNLLYWMTLHTGLTIVERWRHSYDVFPDSSRTQPFGSGATCVYNYRDLQIRNDTALVWRLSLAVGNDHLEGAWLAEAPSDTEYRVYEREHWICQGFQGAYIRNNRIFRQSIRNGQICEDVLVAQNHALMMYPPFLDKP